jgi:formylglycine-generating enzyme required for sulfatase activity
MTSLRARALFRGRAPLLAGRRVLEAAPLKPRHWLAAGIGCALLVVANRPFAQDTLGDEQLAGPPNKEATASWLERMRAWRDERRVRVGYAGTEYARRDLAWTQRSFVQPQVMVEDRALYDVAAGRYTVGRLLDDLDARYGGVDAVLLWPVYPNIGVDDRNQHDLLRDLPGGLAGVKSAVAAFHARGVRVFFPVMPWDHGTRDEGLPLADALARALAAVGADGINGDTLDGIPRSFRVAADRAHAPIALQPENHLASDELLAWNQLSWGYWQFPFVPGVSRAKWLEPRHMVNVCARWSRSRMDELQAAFFNGVGYESWENVWGIWNGITPRASEALRRISRIYGAVPDLLVSAGWEPHAPTLQHGVFASRFPGAREELYTIVNRNDYDVDGEQLRLSGARDGAKYLDLWRGVELVPRARDGSTFLSFPIERRGFASVLVSARPRAAAMRLVSETSGTARPPLATLSAEWKPVPQRLVAIAKTAHATTAPEGMVAIPAASSFDFKVSGVEIEGGDDAGVDVQMPWETSPRRHHRATLPIEPFYLDRTPVTNAQWKSFQDRTHYRPADAHNYLRDWHGVGPPKGTEARPVTWVSIEDARAYCAAHGKRLPHEWEWQYAAQGTDGRRYPWGNEPRAGTSPAVGKTRSAPPADPVDAHPDGASPFGVLDLVGNVWQWTDEYVDDHTRAAIVRGGSNYEPQGSGWYFPQARELDKHGKYLLMAPSKDRSGKIGFRCAAD